MTRAQDLRSAGDRELRRLATRYQGMMHPRTSLEAFPQDHWQGVIERHRQPLAERVWGVLFTVVVSAGAGIGAFFYLAR